jgi:hypothetical protein
MTGYSLAATTEPTARPSSRGHYSRGRTWVCLSPLGDFVWSYVAFQTSDTSASNLVRSYCKWYNLRPMEILEKIKQEARVIKSAPFSFLLFIVVGGSLGYAASQWYYSKQIADINGQLNAKDGQINRYRVALGIDRASKGALVELNNQELALKALAVAAELREFNAALDAKSEAMQKQADANKTKPEQALKDKIAAMKEAAQSFDSNLASDAYNVDNELRRRLDPKAIAHIVRVPALIGEDGTRIPVTAFFRGEMIDLFYIRLLADEIEQMAKLLPSVSEKP